MGQYFPYVVRDIYGTKVIPETVGNVEPVGAAQSLAAFVAPSPGSSSIL